jgi:ornithine--oxo-acid transaminase
VIVEPIQGEGGIITPQKGWLEQLRKLCTDSNILLILDEIQSGLARTGELFAFQHENIMPDGLILGKALGGGLLPVSAFLSNKEVMDHFNPGSHGSTFGGNPLAASVASKALDLIYDDNLISNSKEMGAYLSNQIRDLNLEIIKDVRGKGLWIGVELDKKVSAKKVCLALMDEGILAKETHATVIRFAPPLIITIEEIDWAMERIKRVLNNFAA